jgi:hypothetical protein
MKLRAFSVSFITLIISCLGFFSCSENTAKLFYKKPLVEAGINASVVVKDTVRLNFTELEEEKIELKYLGSGGYYMSFNEDVLLVDPFFSPYPLIPLGLGKIATQPENVKLGMADIEQEVFKYASAICVTHSHYDHLMDVPYVFNHYFDTTDQVRKVYGSASTRNIIKSVVDSSAIEVIDDKVGDLEHAGEWVYLENGSIRFMPIKTEHAPHYKKLVSISLYGGEGEPIPEYTSDTTKMRTNKYKNGPTYGYLVDFLEQEAIIFRLFLLSSASTAPNGLISPDLLLEHEVNIAILGAASFDNVENYPESIITYLKPQNIIIAHWEDLFKPYMQEPPRLIRASNFKKLLPRINTVFPWRQHGEQRLFMPYPGTHFLLEDAEVFSE